MTTVDGTTHAFTATGLTPGLHTVRVAAVNGVGEGVLSDPMPFTVGAGATPGVPTNLSAVANAGSNSGTATLTWSAPANPGSSAISGYLITAAPFNGGAAVMFNASASTTQTVTLAAGQWTFYVQAVNNTGPSTFSSGSNIVTVGPSASSVPGSPTLNVPTLYALTGATFIWQAPSAAGDSALTGYGVYVDGAAEPPPAAPDPPTLTSDDASQPSQVTVNWIPPVFEHGDPVQGYNVQVDGVTVSPGSVTTSSVPGVPTAVTATQSDPTVGSVLVDWNDPVFVGSTALTDYIVTQTGTAAAIYDVGGTTSAYVVNGLTEGSYIFSIVAVNGAGNSTSSATVSIVVTVLANAPTNVVVTGGIASASVTWTDSSDLGGGIGQNCIITAYGSNGSVFATQSSPLGGSGAMAGLAADSYTFTVATVTNVGTGPESAPSNSVVVTTAQSSPLGTSSSQVTSPTLTTQG